VALLGLMHPQVVQNQEQLLALALDQAAQEVDRAVLISDPIFDPIRA
jgi:hypothetical protein